MVENAARVGPYLRRRLQERVGDHPYVGEVRGVGMINAVEFVADRATRRPFDPASGRAPAGRRQSAGAGPDGARAALHRGDPVLAAFVHDRGRGGRGRGPVRRRRSTRPPRSSRGSRADRGTGRPDARSQRRRTMGKMFKGMCVPICTPFVEGGEAVDEGALKAHIDWLLENGVHIILAGGGTGEFAYLRTAELPAHHRGHGQARRRAGATSSSQTSAINTADVIANSKAAADVGADAIMVLPPYFEGPSMDGVRWHYEQIARSVNLPHRRLQHPAALQHRHHAGDLRRAAEDRQHPLHQGQYRQPDPHPAAGGDRAAACSTAAIRSPSRACSRVRSAPSGAPATRCRRRRWRSTISSPSASSAEAAALWERMLPAQLFFWTHDYNPSIKAAPTSPAADRGVPQAAAAAPRGGAGRAQRGAGAALAARPLGRLTEPRELRVILLGRG